MKRKRKAVAGAWMGILLAVCCAAGCGVGESEGENREESGGNVGREETEGFYLTAKQWVEAEKIENSEEVWPMVEYREDFGQKSPDKEMIKAEDANVVDGLDYYILEHYIKWGEAGEVIRRYYLTHVNMETLESRSEELSLGKENQEQNDIGELLSGLAEDLNEGWAEITGMDVQEGRICLLVRQVDRESKTPSHCYAIWLDHQRKAESITDLLPEMEKAGMCRDGMIPDGILCDPEGRFYIGIREYGIFDSAGKFLKMAEVPGGGENLITKTCRLPDGRPVFEAMNSEDRKTTIFYYEGLEEKILYQGEYNYAQTRCLNDKGEIYYITQGGLVRWDGATGKCERIYRDSSLNPLACQAIVETADDTIVMAFYDNDESFLIRLRQNAEVEEKVVTIYTIFADNDLAEYADEYSRKHPGVRIECVTVREAEDDKDMALTRLIARITAGENPDMFLLQSEELAILQDKGLLADLQDWLSAELLGQIFPGVLQSGMVGDKLYGIADKAYIDTAVASKKVWPEETWSFRDVMALAEGNSAVSAVFGGETPDGLLYEMVLRDITAGNSSFVDREAKACYFDSEEFVKVLEFCKKYGLDLVGGESRSFEEIVEGMQKGEILAYRIQGDLKHFSSVMAALGEDFHCVGFPTEGSWGGYVSCFRHIAMHSGGAHQEEAVDFIQYLLSDRIQSNLGIRTVRRDILVNNVKDGNPDADMWSGGDPVFQTMGRAVIPLEGRPDGSSFLPEYLEVIEKSAPMSSWIDTLNMMVIEEAAGYFSGNKSAEDVAEVIQSRVWLYLNE